MNLLWVLLKDRKIENLVDFTRDLKGVRFAENFVSVSNPRSSVTDLRFLIIVLYIYSFFLISNSPQDSCGTLF